MSDSVAEDQIRSYFERWKRLEGEKDAVSTDLRELFAEMKGNGFDTKVARKVFRDKEADPTERSEFEAIYDLYWVALSGPRAGRARERVEIAHTEPQSQPAAQSQSNLSAPDASPDRREGDDDGQPIQPGASSNGDDDAAEGLGKVGARAGGATPPTGSTIQPETAVTDEPDGETDAAGDFEREVAQSDPAHLIGGNIVADGSSRSTNSPKMANEPTVGTATGKPAEPSGSAALAPVYTFTPKPHDGPFSSNGLPRQKGCQHVDACAGTWRALCAGCKSKLPSDQSEPENAA